MRFKEFSIFVTPQAGVSFARHINVRLGATAELMDSFLADNHVKGPLTKLNLTFEQVGPDHAETTRIELSELGFLSARLNALGILRVFRYVHL